MIDKYKIIFHFDFTYLQNFLNQAELDALRAKRAME